MKLFRFVPVAAIVAACFSAHPADADQLPGAHPALLHALSDLRASRWFLFHQAGDAKVYEGEDAAIHHIEVAIADIKKEAVDDGKDLNDHPNVDTKEHGSRLLKAIETLDAAAADVRQEEDNPRSHELRNRSLDHIREAHDAAVRAHNAWLKEQRH